MIHLSFEGKTATEMSMIHEALAGWKAYVDCDVVLSDREDGYDLFIGPDNGEDIQIDMEQYVIWKPGLRAKNNPYNEDANDILKGATDERRDQMDS